MLKTNFKFICYCPTTSKRLESANLSDAIIQLSKWWEKEWREDKNRSSSAITGKSLDYKT